MLTKRAQGRPPKIRDYAKEAAIAEDYRSGMALKDIVAKHGLSSACSIYSILDQLSIPRRTTNRQPPQIEGAA